ncbi:hypothetical protein L2E82_30414 [Cichorium intybus]|uniref:Uncharacterized protein n=1 Tax=Cichorium intybus TaxID=13427 RepID=A0ACB9D0R8_CICIN|nr:hypothetical protein L2E82_30414 [Cichorium intybus]
MLLPKQRVQKQEQLLRMCLGIYHYFIRKQGQKFDTRLPVQPVPTKKMGLIMYSKPGQLKSLCAKIGEDCFH